MSEQDETGEGFRTVQHPNWVTAQEAIKLREAADPGVGVLMLPDPAVFGEDRDPLVALDMLRMLGASVIETFAGAAAVDHLNGPHSRNVRDTAVALENALVELYEHDPRILARAYVQHFVDDLQGVEIDLDATAAAIPDESETR